MLFDSWCWIEFFKGTEAGKRTREIMRKGEAYASVLTLAEVADWCSRNGVDAEKYLSEIRRVAAVLQVDEETAQTAGLNLKHLRENSPGLGMMDSLIYHQAAGAGLELATGDSHLKNLAGVKFIDRTELET